MAYSGRKKIAGGVTVMTAAHTINEKGHGCDPVPFQNHNPDSPIENRAGKASAALKAKFARAGHLVHDGGNGDYIVVKADWCMSRHCPNYAALVSFGRVLGVA